MQSAGHEYESSKSSQTVLSHGPTVVVVVVIVDVVVVVGFVGFLVGW